MLHTETVDATTLALIKRLSADEKLKDFVLVGGTALSLQLGHRKSIDIDLFSAKAFDPKAIVGHLESAYSPQIDGVLGNAIFAKINNIKTDLIAHQYPWVDGLMEIDGIRMASLKEIGAMKLSHIELLGRDFSWPEVRKRLKDAVINPRHIFQGVKPAGKDIQKEEGADRSKRLRRGRSI